MAKTAAKRSGSETSQSIIDGAISVMAEEGLPQLTTKRVSERADVSTAAIHYFFETKDRLIYESFVHVVGNIRRQFLDVRKSTASPLDCIRQTMDVFFSAEQITGDTVKIWPQLWVHAGTDAQTARLFKIYNGRMVSNFTYDLCRAGLPRAAARSFALRLNALHRGLWIELHLGGQITRGETAEIYAAMMETIAQSILNQRLSKGEAA